MKKIAIIATLTSLTALAGMRAVNVSSGAKTLDERYVPYGCAELKGVECLMYRGNGALSMSVDRTMGEVINHVEYDTHYGTNVVTNVVEKLIDVRATATASLQYHGASTNAFYYTNSVYKIGSDGFIGDIDLGFNTKVHLKFTPYSGMSGSYATGYTNIHIAAYANWFTGDFSSRNSVNFSIKTNIQTSSSAYTNTVRLFESKTLPNEWTGDPETFVLTADVKIEKSPEHDHTLIRQNTYVDHVVTNRWSEGVSKTWTVNVLDGAQLTNGMFVKYFDSPLHVFKGDVIRCTSPITTNNPGRVRAIIADDSFGTQSPFLNEE